MSGSSTIGRAAMVVSGGILLSRLLGFGRDVVLLGLLGRGTDADLYQAAFAVPDLIFFLMAGGYLSITLVPILTRHLTTGDETGAGDAFNTVFGVVVGAMIVLSLVLMAAAEPITDAFYWQFARPEQLRLAHMLRIAFASQVFFAAGTLLMAAQYARRRFVIPTLAPLVYNLSIILGGLIGAMLGDPTPEAFLWGGLTGAAVGNFGLQWFGARSAGFRLRPSFSPRHPVLAEYFALALPLMIGLSVVALDEWWPRIFGQLGDEGTISGVLAARKINMLPVGLIAQAAGVAAYPFLARLAAERRDRDLNDAVLSSIRSSVVLAGLAAAGVAALARPAVRLAYQRGEFTADDTAFVAGILAVYAISIPLWTAHQIYTRGFYAERRMWTPVLIGSALTAMAVPMYLWVTPRDGGPGLAWISVGSMAVYTAVTAAVWHRRRPWNGLGETVWKTLVAASISGGAGWFVVGRITGTDLSDTLVQAGTGSVVIVAVYAAITFGLRSEAAITIAARRRGDQTSVNQP